MKLNRRFDKITGPELRSVSIKDSNAADVKFIKIKEYNLTSKTLEDTPKDIIIGGIPITFKEKIGPLHYKFAYENGKETLKFEKFMRHIVDTIARAIKEYGPIGWKKTLTKKEYIAVIDPIIDIKKKTMVIKLFDDKKKLKTGEKITMLGTKIYQMVKDENTGNTGNFIKKNMEPLKANEFDKRYKVGTKFIPEYRFDNITIGQKRISITMTLESLQIIGTPSVGKTEEDIYNYVNSDESDEEVEEKEEKEEIIEKKEEIINEKKLGNEINEKKPDEKKSEEKKPENVNNKQEEKKTKIISYEEDDNMSNPDIDDFHN